VVNYHDVEHPLEKKNKFDIKEEKKIYCHTFIIPFQLSPVAMRNNVRKAIPKSLKCACLSRPVHRCSSLHSNLPNNSTPSAANMKKSRKNRRPYKKKDSYRFRKSILNSLPDFRLEEVPELQCPITPEYLRPFSIISKLKQKNNERN